MMDVRLFYTSLAPDAWS